MITLDDGSERRMARALTEMETRQTIAHVERYIAMERCRAIGVPAHTPPIRSNQPMAGERAYEPQSLAPGGRDWWVEVGAWAFAVTVLVLIALALYWAVARH